LETATNIRESIEKKEFNHFLIKQMKDVRDVSNSLYNNWMNDKSEKIVITNSNKKALDYNIALRGKRYNEKDIIAGDRLIVVANNYRHHLLNGDFVDIVEISGESEKHSIKLRGREEATVLSFRKLKVAVTSSEKVVSIMDVMILENLIWSPERSLSRDELVAIRVLAAQKANTKFPSKWLLKNDLKKYILQKEKYIKEMKENEYYNALQVKFGYAITCHKAQGGEWDNVYVDFSSNGSINNQKYFRWSYTAITRAKRELLYLNAPSISSWSNLITGSVTNNSADFDMEENTSFNVDVPESINSGLPKNLYLVVSKNILDSTFLIESVKPLNWRERYQFTSGDDYCTVDFLYNKKGNLIKNIIDSSSKKVSDNLLELLANVKVVSTIQESIDYNFPKPFLKEFHNIIENGFKQTGIKISKLKHNNYAENYQFSSLTEFCDLIFYYNDKDMFSKSSPILNNCSNKSFADKCISQINFYLAND